MRVTMTIEAVYVLLVQILTLGSGWRMLTAVVSET